MSKTIKRPIKKRSLKKLGNETEFLLSSTDNSARLSESINQDKLGKVSARKFQKMAVPRKVDRANFKLLTDHQIQIVFMICKEKTVAEIARKLNISEKTFFNTRLNIFKKLAVKSTVGLVKYVYKYGYLKL